MSTRSMLEDVYPLSPTQEGMLFHTLDDQGAGVYVGQFGFRLRAALDEDAFERAWQAVVDRHPALRTGFQWEKVDTPLQVVRRAARLPFARRDWRHLPRDEQTEALRAYLAADRARGFDLSRAPLIRLALLRTGDAEHQLVWTHHHMILDGWSLGVVYRDVLEAYQELRAGRQPARAHGAPYRDFIAWLRQRDPAASEAFWRGYLAGFQAATPLEIGAAPAAGTPHSAYLKATVSAADTEALQALARRARATLNIVVQGAWALLLSRWSGQPDVVLGAVFSGRPASLPGADQTVGLFVNTLPVRVRVPGGTAVLPWIAELQRDHARLVEHEHTPLSSVQRWSEVPRGQPLFESILAFQNFRAEAGAAREGFGVDEVWGTEADDTPLTLAVSPGPEGLSLELAFHPERIAPARAQRLVSQLAAVLAAFAADPARALHDVPLLDAEERARTLALGRGPEAPYPAEALVHHLLAERALAWPDAVAVIHGDSTVTYAALHRRAERLARTLRARGVGPESRVALFLGRGVELAVSLLAVLRAGGAYVPVDPDYPAERIAFLLRDCGAALVLTHAGLRGALPAGGAEVLLVDEDEPDGPLPAAGEGGTGSEEPEPDGAAYAIYTSGSTGQPKAAVISHRSLLCYAEAMRAALGLSPADRFLQFASPSFDVMVEEIFPAWLSGAAVVFPGGDLLGDPAGLMDEVAAHGVTCFELPTAFWHEWVRTMDEEGARLPSCVRFVIVGGERVLPERLRQWARLNTPLVHVFGLTETSVTSTTLRLRAGEDASASPNLSVGRPLPNVELYLLDPRGEPSPAGVPGELFVGGDGVGRGCLNRPALTAERFVPHPHSARAGARLYRTGDRARWMEDGALEFLGRIDQQVKVRGFRIEPAEIEAVLSGHPSVAEAVVALRGTAAGQQQLVAYVIPADGGAGGVSDQELREYVRGRLPEYMVPAAVVSLASLPLSPNGKLDRRALPDPAPAAASKGEEPRTAVEATLARIWSEVLKVESVGIHDDYFALGGDSILSIQIVARARRAGLHLRPRQLFLHPTVARLAEQVETVSAAPAASAATGSAPLLPIQRWFFDQPMAERRHWNMSLLLELGRPVHPAAMEAAFRAVVDHHDALRFRYTQGADGWTQGYAAAGEPPAFDRADLSRVPDGELAAEIARRAARAQRGLNLERGPLIRALLLEPGGGRPARLLLAAHHLVMDGVSWRILLDDLQAAYARLESGRPAALPARTTSYGRFAERLAVHAAAGGFDGEADFWAAPERAAAVLLPVDLEEGDNTAGSARTVTVSLGEEETRALLRDVPAAFRTQVNDLLLAALARALVPWAGGAPLLVDVEGHGREELFDGVDLTRTVGWFTTVYPVLLDLRAAATPVDALMAVRRQLRAVPGNGIGYGALRWMGPPPLRTRLAALPAAQVRFEYLGRFDGGGQGEELFRRAAESAGPEMDPSAPRSHLLEASASVVGGCLEFSWSYSARVHRRETVQALLDACVAELRALAAEARAGRRAAWTAADFPLSDVGESALRAAVGDAAGVEDVLPAAPMAEGMLFETRMAHGGGMYVAQLVFDLDGPLDRDALARAWRTVVERHAALRSSFAGDADSGRPLQVVHGSVDLAFAEEDWSGAGEGLDARLEAYLAADRARGFDPSTPPLMRLALFGAGPERAVMVWSFLQLLLDGWSLPVVFRELMALYDVYAVGGKPSLPAAPAYRDYVAWLARRDPSRAERYWRGELGGVSAPTPLGIDRIAAEAEGAAHATAEAVLSPGATERLSAAARAHGLTLSTLVQGAWALLLARYSGEREVVFGVTVSGRPAELPGVEDMVGVFINTLPVRVVVDEEAPVAGWLAGLQRRQAEMREHEHTPLVVVQGWSGVARGQPLFETLFVFENYPADELPAAAGRSLRVRQRDTREQNHYPLSLVALPSAAGLRLHLGYERRRIDDGAAERALDHLRTLLAEMAADPSRAVGTVPLTGAAERARVVEEWNRTDMEFNGPATIHAWFEAQAARTPDAPALTFEGETLTYAETNFRANRLAHHLAALGVGPEVRVGVCAERSHEMVIALLAILKAGGAYVPLDPDHPADRLAWMAGDASVAVLLAQPHTAARIPSLPGVRMVTLHPDTPRAGRDDDPRVALRADNAAYVIYTSGSTGRPKGVINTHGGIRNRLLWMAAEYGLGPGGVVLQKTPFSFDVSLWELFLPLMTGARMVIARPEGHRDPAYLADLVQAEGVTQLHFVPSMLAAFLEGGGAERCRSVRHVFCSGEALPREVAQRAMEGMPAASLHNLYGPTEAAVDVSHWTCVPGAPRVPIGAPLANTRLYVLDGARSPVPIGVAGELYIGGVQVARGYLGRPGLTAERFVPDPFHPGARLYRTGDRARWTADGTVEYLGRMDFQVKLRGFRIEPGEIEAVLQEVPGVRQAVVVVREDAPGAQRLVAYLVPREGDGAGVADQARAGAEARLPEYMVPAALVVMDALPLTASGKVDRRALPAPAGVSARAPSTPRTPTEQILAGIWADVLRVEAAGPADSFFDLGGHSLLATRVAARVRRHLGVELPLRALFEAPTLGRLAARVDALLREGAGAGAGAEAPPVVPVPRERPLPLSFAQQRLWFLDQLHPGEAAYNLPQLLRLRGPLDEDALERALSEVVARHEVLRTVFGTEAGHAVQHIRPLRSVPLIRVDLRGLAEADREAEARRLAREQAARPFDLARGPLLRAALVRMAQDDALGMLTLHHIVIDGWSSDVLAGELAALYEAFTRGAPSPLVPLPVQYGDYAVWQREWLAGGALERQTAYWRARLAGAPPLLNVPADRPRPAVAGTHGATRPFTLSAELSDRLRTLSRAEGVTLFMTLLAAFQALLGRIAGEDDVSVGTPVAGRGRLETEGLIGLFVNTLVVRTDLSGDPAFRELLARVREATLGAYAHQDVPFEKLVDAMEVPRTLAHTPLFQVMLVMQNAGAGSLDLGGVRAEPFATRSSAARFDLTLEVQDGEGALYGTLDYRTDLFDADTAERMLGWFTRLLEGAAAHPELPLSRISILGAEERTRVVEEWNRTDGEFDGPPFIHRWIEARAARTPDVPAVTFQGDTLTYGELNARANRLAHHLMARGVGAEVRVGVCAERSHELVIALLAVMKAGGAYVPLDPSYPADRLAFMVEDSAIPLLLVQARTAGVVAGAGTVIQLDGDDFAGMPERDPAVPLHPLNAAYVIYTSGSTGRPKGVVNSHQGIRNRLAWMRDRFGMGPGHVVLQKTPVSFDISVWELFAPLMTGARLVMARPGGHRDGDYLVGLIRGEGITDLHFVPSMLAAFLETPGVERCTTVARMYCAGEALSREVMARALERLPGMELHNTYGPTEAAVDVSHWHCRADAPVVPIGTPLPNCRLYVLDGALQPVPPGVAGELYLAGVQLGRGYLGRPGLTAERWLPDPFARGARMYRSGDRARWTTAGEVEYLGRTDFQVKLRGFRIEPGEIEAVLERHPGVRQAVVVVREDVPGAPRLVAYIVPREGAHPGLADDARAYLQGRVPEYMVPGVLVMAPAIPLTPSGKLDRRALPAPAPVETRAFTPPRTPAEEAVARCWAEVLGGAPVGAHDNFFSLGGDSILSIQVVARLRRAGWRVTARDLFEHSTVAALARVAAREAPEAAAADDGGEAGGFPLTPIQAWFLDARAEDPHHFTLPVLLEAREPVDAGVLQRALDAVAAHHPALRARFQRDGAGWRTAPAAPAAPVPLRRVPLSGLGDAERNAALAAAAEALQAELNVERGPLFAAALLEGGGGWTRLFLAAHHLVVDGVSWRVLLEDLGAAYDAIRRGERPALPPPTASFAAWARALAGRAEQGGFDDELPYWTSRGRRAAGALPADFAGGDDRAGDAESLSATLDAEATRALLRDLPAAFRTRIDEALLAALARTLATWTGEGRVWVDVEGHGRDDRFGIDTSRTAGWFTSLYPVLLQADADADEGAVLRAVKEQMRGVPGGGLGFGALRWLGGPGARAALAALPRPEIVFNYLGQVGGSSSSTSAPFVFAGEDTGAAQSRNARRAHALEVAAIVEEGELRVVWTWGRARFRAETVRKLAAGFIAELRSLVAYAARAGEGGCTPSDFPLARLDEAGLRAVVRESRGVEDIYPLTPLQEGMLFHTRDEPGAGAYVGRFAFELRGELNEQAFARAWETVMARHPVLRTRFVWEGVPAPLQVVEPRAPLPLHREDWRGLSAGEAGPRWDALAAAELARGLDVRSAPPMRLALVRTGDRAWRVLWAHHHLLLDGWSVGHVYADLLAAYGALARGAEPALPDAPPPYRRYVEWLAGRDPGDAEAFWRGMLGDFTSATPLGIEQRATPDRGHGGAGVELDPARTAGLAAFVRARGLTLNTLVQGAWALVLSRYSSSDDVVFGATVSGRPAELAGVEGMVGLFINTLPVRVRVPHAQPVEEWLRGLQAASAAARVHEHTPLVQVRGWSGVPAGEPLFHTLLVFENFPVSQVLAGSETPGLEFGELPMPGIATNYPLSLTVAPGATLRIRATFDTRRLGAAEVRRMLEHLAGVMDALAADGGRRVADVPLLSGEELRGALASSRGRVAEIAHPAGVHQLFEAQARRAPEAVALVRGAERMAYGELDRRANRLANALCSLGAGPEARVAVLLERGPSAVVAMLAILKAGGVYLPLDASYPAERLAYMLADSGARLVVTEARLADRLPETDARRLLLDDDHTSIRAGSGTRPSPDLAPENLAYVIYTSGSTGRPKGVLTPHAGVMNYLAFLGAEYGIRASDTVLQLASLSFDASIRDILGPLSFGARVVFPEAEELADPARLPALARAHGVTAIMAAVPSTLRAMLAGAEESADGALRLLLVSGEALPAGDCVRARAVFGARTKIVNQWGATECTMSSTFHPVDADEAAPVAPIGKPGLNAAVYVLDGALRPVPAGVAGEAYISTPGVARGYGGRPGLTAERFLPDPFAAEPGTRMYHVGDRVRRRGDGVLEYLGRTDEQVKVQGVRVEPGEVEAALRSHAAVRAAAVVAWRDGGGEGRLAAYVVPEPGATQTAPGDGFPPAMRGPGVDEPVLRAHLAALLPAALIPGRIFFVDTLPLLPNGKLDRRALPAPDAEREEGGGYTAPRTPVEDVLAAIWCDVLGTARVGVDDDFFALGGHSLLAMRVAARVREALGIDLPLRALFEDATIARLATRIDGLRADGGDAAPPLVPAGDGPLPLSFAQQRLWFAHRMDPGSVAYNMPFALRLRGALDVDALRRALLAVIDRHHVLRTRFVMRGDAAVQVVEAAELPFALVELENLSPEARAAEVERVARVEAARPFSLARAPMLRATLARLSAREHVLLLTLHHVAADGWSLEVLTREAAALYASLRGGRPSPLPPLPVQYGDYAAWQRARLAGQALEGELAWWRNALAGVPAALSLPTDFPHPATPGEDAGIAERPMRDETRDGVQALARRESATPYMALAGALAILLYRYSGQDDLVLGAPAANRTRPEVQGLVGFFVNLLPLRVRLAGNPVFRDLVRQVRATALGAYTHAELPFEMLVQEAERAPGRRPLVQVGLEMERGAGGDGEMDGVRLSAVPIHTRRAKFDLEVRVVEDGRGGWTARLYYDASLFLASTAARMLDDFISVLDQVAADPELRALDLGLGGDAGAIPAAAASDADFDF